MSVRRISPAEARTLMDEDGYAYLDVRSIPEFEAGHPTGAYNVPLLHAGPGGMTPNPDFLAVVQRSFPTDAKLVLGCRGGVRSLNAAELLTASGYTGIVEQRAGYEGSQQGESGWVKQGLPTATEAEAARSYAELSATGEE
jgi:rhodanese-related sulfurtransferase